MTTKRLIKVPDLDDESLVDRLDTKLAAHTRFKAAQQVSKTATKTTIVSETKEKNKETNLPLKRTLNDDENKEKTEKVQVLNEQLNDEPTTSFEKAFSNLKTSKYFQIPSVDSVSSEKSKPIPQTKPVARSNNILVNSRQRGNPILKFIRNVPIQYDDIIPDFVLSPTTCALYLSLRYHLLKPDYIHERLKQLGRQFQLRVLLVQVDVKDPHHGVKELTKISILADCTLLLAWSAEESGRYLETYKVFEDKPPDMLMEKQEDNPVSQMLDALSSIKSITRTNAKTLLSTFRSFKNITEADKDHLSFCPGLGPQRATRLYETLREPFLRQDNEEAL